VAEGVYRGRVRKRCGGPKRSFEKRKKVAQSKKKDRCGVKKYPGLRKKKSMEGGKGKETRIGITARRSWAQKLRHFYPMGRTAPGPFLGNQRERGSGIRKGNKKREKNLIKFQTCEPGARKES